MIGNDNESCACLSDGSFLGIISNMSDSEEYFKNTRVRSFRVERETIWYLHFIFEAYDGLATVSTVDSRKGLVEIRIPESRVEEVEILLNVLSSKIHLEALS